MICEFKMSHGTRSQGPVSTDAEIDIRQKHLDEREKQLRAQHQALLREREEIEKRATEAIDANSLMQVLSKIQSELSQLQKLPEQINMLEQRVNETSRAASAYEEYQSMPAQNEVPASFPILKLKDVASNIPAYDGYKISVFQFARACERARDLLSSVQEPQLVQFIINKLEGDAYQVVEGNMYTRVVDLLDKLKAIFAPNKSIAQYRGELANTYKLPAETILKYAGRVKDLKFAILDGNRRQGKSISRTFIEEIDGEVLEAFINGLPSNIITRMEHRQITDLDVAIEWAVKISNNLEVEKLRERQSSQKTAPLLRSDIQNIESPHAEPPKSILKNPNTLIPRPWIRPLIPGVPGPNSPDVCRYCKFPGHNISNCKKLAYRNSVQNPENLESRPIASAARDTAHVTAHPISVQAEPIISEG